MRVSNAEWDFMGRSYLVWRWPTWLCANRRPKRFIRTMDQIIGETLRLEKRRACIFPDALRQGPEFLVQPARSLFLDGEIALMLASRRVVEEKPEYKPVLTERERNR